MSAYTCITCHVAFGEPEHQRQHYKTDWHRYNLKRKVVGMPPVTATAFQQKVKEHRVVESNENEGIAGFFCKICQKRFGSHKAFENHQRSKKHKDLENVHMERIRQNLSKEDLSQDKEGDVSESENVRKILADAKADIDKPKIIRTDEVAEPKREFASGDNPRMRWFKKQAKALKEADQQQDDEDEWEDMDDSDEEEMEDEEDEYVVLGGQAKDEDADIESLSSEMVAGMKQRLITPVECLFCLKKLKSIEANVLHMSKQHGFFIPDLNYLINLEGLLNYLGEKIGMGNVCIWCNEKGKAFYSISAVLKHMKDKGHCNMLVTGDAALEYADFYDFGEMDDEDSDDETMEEEDVVEEVTGEDSQDLELVLPSGASIGHRSLMKYYKQKFPTVERQNTSKQKTLARLIAQYKAIGWHGSTASDLARSQKDLAYLQSMKAKYRMKLSVKNNRTQMKHFRSQVFI